MEVDDQAIVADTNENDLLSVQVKTTLRVGELGFDAYFQKIITLNFNMRPIYDKTQKIAHLKKLLTRMDRLLQSGEIQSLSGRRKRNLIHRLRRLFRQLQPNLSSFSVRPALLAALATIGIGMVSNVEAQNFGALQINPFGIANTGSNESKPCLVDIDNDGDLDLFAGSSSGTIFFAENTGSATAPAFGTFQNNPFGITPGNYYTFVSLKDMDNDGDYDLIIGEGYPISILYCENTGTASAPAFGTQQTNPFGISFSGLVGYEAKPVAADMDNDGDFDLVVGYNYGDILYFQNTGTATAPAFAAYTTNPFGITNAGTYAAPTVADLDGDGDFDLGINTDTGDFFYFENTGTSSAAAFTSPVTNPFGIVQGYYYTGGILEDLDGDGDLDLLRGVEDGDFYYQEDTSSVVIVNQPPTLSLGITNDTICSIDTLGPIAFTATDPDGYPSPVFVTAVSSNQSVIADANITVSGTSPNYTIGAVPSTFGSADIYITVSDSMDSVTDTLSVVVDDCTPVNSPPAVMLSAYTDTFCAVIDTLGPLAFTVTDPDGDPVTVTATSSNQTAIANGDIQITGTPPNLFLTATSNITSFVDLFIYIEANDGTVSTTDTLSVQVQYCQLSMDESSFAKDFQVFPNPADQQLSFSLNLHNPVGMMEIELMDLQGRTVLKRNLGAGADFFERLDIAHLPAGMYMLKAESETYRLNRKVVIE